MANSQTNVGCLVARVALGKQGKMFQNRIEHHIKRCGVEWTNSRLKAIWNAALCLRSGEYDKAIELYRENSIAYHRHSLIPKGIEGVPVARFVNAQRPSVIKRQAAVLRYYCSLRLSDVSDKQRKKALTAISSPISVPESQENLERLGREWTDNVLKRAIVSKKDGRTDYSYVGPKSSYFSTDEVPLKGKEIHADHLHGTTKYYSRFKVPRDLRGIPYSSMAMSFMTEPWLPSSLDKVTPCQEMRELIRNTWLKEHPQQYAGKITFLQEQGCKARVVCQPSAWLQLAFMPLHNRLAKQADTLFPQESCVKDQVQGAYTLMDHLSHGYSVYCTDLSSATDRFPRAFSLGVLRSLGHSAYADALEAVCQQPFLCDESPSGDITYGVGQPMGLYGSFPLFHISNMVVAYSAVKAAEEQARKECVELISFTGGTYFRTVGDDIIFSDALVAQAYRDKMSHFGVQISESKSFQGNVGEFAGFIGVTTNRDPVVFRPYKVPDKNLNNAIQFLDALGSKVSSVSPYWAQQFKTYWSTVGSRNLALDPLVPGESNGPIASANRGDNRTVINLCNAIAMQCTEDLPDLSGNTKINRVPLFQERGVFDFYGYNPDELRKAEQMDKQKLRGVNRTLSQDPLFAEAKRIQKDPSVSRTRLVPPRAQDPVSQTTPVITPAPDDDTGGIVEDSVTPIQDHVPCPRPKVASPPPDFSVIARVIARNKRGATEVRLNSSSVANTGENCEAVHKGCDVSLCHNEEVVGKDPRADLKTESAGLDLARNLEDLNDRVVRNAEANWPGLSEDDLSGLVNPDTLTR